MTHYCRVGNILDKEGNRYIDLAGDIVEASSLPPGSYCNGALCSPVGVLGAAFEQCAICKKTN